jgi:L-fuconolactonase
MSAPPNSVPLVERVDPIDAHAHFWHYDPLRQPWMTPRHAPVKRDFEPRDLAPLLLATGTAGGCVAVQASQTPEETRFLLGLAAAPRSPVRGVVGWCDLRAEPAALRAELAALSAAHGRSAPGASGRLVGMRHVVHDEPDDHFCTRPDFARGVAMLGEFGLAYDLLLFPRHLAPALELARATPDVTFVLDHLANPHVAATAAAARRAAGGAGAGAGAAPLEPEAWERDLRALAALPNVFVKASGLPTLATWGDFADEDFFPFLDVVFDAFGRERVMTGSDWPVCTLAADYARTSGIVRGYMARRGFPQADVDAVLGGNCVRAYRLAPLAEPLA